MNFKKLFPAIIFCLLASSAYAADCVVKSAAASGVDTFATHAANSACTKITFDSTAMGAQIITLTAGVSLKYNNIVIDGGSEGIVIEGNFDPSLPLLSTAKSNLTIKNLTFEHAGGLCIAITGSNNKVLENAFLDSGTGIKITGKGNKISKNIFSGITERAIFLASSGNNNFSAPTELSAILTYPEVWTLTGNANGATQVELYFADEGYPGIPQGMELAGAIGISENEETFEINLPINDFPPEKQYTLIAIKDNGDTSAFSPNFIAKDSELFFSNYPDCESAAWLFDGTGNWYGDADGDLLLNIQEDVDQDCAGSLNETNPVDSDSDDDGLSDSEDNCPLIANGNQADTDGDGVGDVCGADADADGLYNVNDNCPLISNSSQSDIDADGLGDACDIDKDGDGIADAQDNCKDVANSGQEDIDGDGVG
ncbi:MAG: thrombospondin type 3 repeat-containing protein, partial [Deltaproteobacteria bacterium]|nr:thrombospondin type 3 repeat-containing protein [Deltaproteobacteria bacterium]